MNENEIIIKINNRFNLSVSEEIVLKVKDFIKLLIEKNKVINLTSIKEEAEIYKKHYEDSLLGAKYILEQQGIDILDMGAGAGFPTLPLAINLPQYRFTAVDSVRKKIDFINEVKEKLDLKKVFPVHCRAEDMDKNKKYDVGLARAVAPLNVLSELVLPFIKIGGIFIAYKSEVIEEEINAAKNAIKILGGKIVKIDEVKLDEETVRKFVIIQKISETEKKYPRGKNKPRTEPL